MLSVQITFYFDCLPSTWWASLSEPVSLVQTFITNIIAPWCWIRCSACHSGFLRMTDIRGGCRANEFRKSTFQSGKEDDFCWEESCKLKKLRGFKKVFKIPGDVPKWQRISRTLFCLARQQLKTNGTSSGHASISRLCKEIHYKALQHCNIEYWLL